MVVSCSGHRPSYFPCKYNEKDRWLIGLKWSLFNWLKEQEDISLVCTGMALGWDTLVAQACVKLEIPFEAHIPFRGQQNNWPVKSKIQYESLLKKAVNCHYIYESFSDSAFIERNKIMVDKCDVLIILLDPKTNKGGTLRAYNYAKSKNKEIINFWPKEI